MMTIPTMDNEQALGYLLSACKSLNLKKDFVRRLKNEMIFQFDVKTPEEAEKSGHEWYYSLDD